MQHVVLISFKEPGKAELFLRAVGDLRQTIGGITSYVCGPYSSPEGLNQGYTHGFVMTFAAAADRDAYLVHPDHEKLKDAFLPFVSQVVAFDFAI